eukprot:EG_transcript_22461
MAAAMLACDVGCSWEVAGEAAAGLSGHVGVALTGEAGPAGQSGPVAALGTCVTLRPPATAEGDPRPRCTFRLRLPSAVRVASVTFIGSARNVEVSGRRAESSGEDDWDYIGTTQPVPSTTAGGPQATAASYLQNNGPTPSCDELLVKVVGIPLRVQLLLLDLLHLQVVLAPVPAKQMLPPAKGSGTLDGFAQMMMLMGPSLQRMQALQPPAPTPSPAEATPGAAAPSAAPPAAVPVSAVAPAPNPTDLHLAGSPAQETLSSSGAVLELIREEVRQAMAEGLAALHQRMARV